MTEIYGRWQEAAIERAVRTRRVILLNGSRQCGKTTLAKQFASQGVAYRTFIGIVLYSGEYAGSIGEMGGNRGDNLWAIPFGALWGYVSR